MNAAKRIDQLKAENKKLVDLLNSTWFMLDVASLNFNNGVTSMGVDEGHVKGWKTYNELEKQCLPYFKEWR